MNHKIISRQPLVGSHWQVDVEFQPDSAAEVAAILKVERMDADETERGMVDNYLLFGLSKLGNYSFVRPIKQKGRLFTIVVYSNQKAISSFG